MAAELRASVRRTGAHVKRRPHRIGANRLRNKESGFGPCHAIDQSEEDAVPLLKITNFGLLAIACAVAILWSCVLGERTLTRRAAEERQTVIRSMERMQKAHHLEPAAPSQSGNSLRV